MICDQDSIPYTIALQDTYNWNSGGHMLVKDGIDLSHGRILMHTFKTNAYNDRWAGMVLLIVGCML